jgi:hypothetical protein
VSRTPWLALLCLAPIVACSSQSPVGAGDDALEGSEDSDAAQYRFEVSLSDRTGDHGAQLDKLADRMTWIFEQNGVSVDISTSDRSRPFVLDLTDDEGPCSGSTSVYLTEEAKAPRQYFTLGEKKAYALSTVGYCAGDGATSEQTLLLTAHALAHELLHQLLEMASNAHAFFSSVQEPSYKRCSPLAADIGHLDAPPDQGSCEPRLYNLNMSGGVDRPDNYLEGGRWTNGTLGLDQSRLSPFETIAEAETGAGHLRAIFSLAAVVVRFPAVRD